MKQPAVFRGTLEEINSRYGSVLAGRLLTVTVERDTENSTPAPFYESASVTEWSQAWRQWADGHDSNAPLLSDAGIDRDGIYEGRG